MKKIIITIMALNFANSAIADVNGKWLNTGNTIINLNHVGHIDHLCFAGIIKFHRSIAKSEEIFSLSVGTEDCENVYEDIEDFLNDDDSYKHL